jgi:hypothetical protein
LSTVFILLSTSAEIGFMEVRNSGRMGVMAGRIQEWPRGFGE